MKFDRITRNPAVLGGQPCIKDTRLTVRRVLHVLALYPDRTELHFNYPGLDDESIRQALDYAAMNLEDVAVPMEWTHEVVA